MALSIEYRTRDQEVVGSTLGRARGVKTLGMFLTPMWQYVPLSPSSISWYLPKGAEYAGPMMSTLRDQKCSTGKCGTENAGPGKCGTENGMQN